MAMKNIQFKDGVGVENIGNDVVNDTSGTKNDANIWGIISKYNK